MAGDTSPTVPAAERILVAVIAFAAATPSLVAGVLGTGFLTDDWAVWLAFDRRGTVGGLLYVAFEQPARPLAAPYYAILYQLIGDVPFVQALLIAAVNGFLAFAAWSCGRRFLPTSVLWPALIVLAVAPNHAMTRMWFVVGTYPLAVALALLAVAALDRRRTLRAAALSVGAVLLYEGVVAFLFAAVAVWALVHRREARSAAAVGGAALLAATGMLLISSKHGGGGPTPFNNIESFWSGQIGAGLWSSPRVGVVAGLLLLAGLTVAIAQILPSFRSDRPEPRLAILGAAFAAAGAAPYVYEGATFATTGVFDRNNVVPAVGIAVMIGALLAMTSRMSAWAAVAVGAVMVAIFLQGQWEDIRNFSDAVQRGDGIVAEIADHPWLDDDEPIFVVPEQASYGTGIADFVYDADLVGALRYRHGGNWGGVQLVERAACGQLGTKGSVQVFDWTTARAARLPGGTARDLCTAVQMGKAVKIP